MTIPETAPTEDEYLAQFRAETTPAPPSANGHHPPASQFFDGRTFAAPRLAEYVQDRGHVCPGVDGRLYRYRGGVYRPDGETFARHTVRKVLGAQWKARHGEEAIRWLQAEYPKITEHPPEQWVNCSNGLLNWRTGELRRHTPDVRTTVQIPVPWTPDAGCPLIDRFLGEVLPADTAALMYELTGYVLLAGNPLRRALLLLGPGRNGKSVLLGIIKALVGEANISTLPLQNLAENRFAPAELFGKLANISGDLDARAIKQTDVFKMATGGDPITAERKYGSAFTFTPFATFLFAANEAPISSDQSAAWFDRWLVVPLERRLAESEVDPHLLGKLTTPTELAGLLVRAVAGLQSLMDRGSFDEPGAVRDAGNQYRDRLDTVRGYVTEECRLQIDAWTERPQLYRRYSAWCREGGRLPVSAVNFNDHLRRNHVGQVEEITRNGRRGWAGIALLTPDEATR